MPLSVNENSQNGSSRLTVITMRGTLPPLNFTAAEMVAIAVSLAREENTPFAAANRSALRKILATASVAQTAEAAELMDRNMIRLVEASPFRAGLDPEHWALLAELNGPRALVEEEGPAIEAINHYSSRLMPDTDTNAPISRNIGITPKE